MTYRTLALLYKGFITFPFFDVKGCFFKFKVEQSFEVEQSF